MKTGNKQLSFCVKPFIFVQDLIPFLSNQLFSHRNFFHPGGQIEYLLKIKSVCVEGWAMFKDLKSINFTFSVNSLDGM